MLVSHLQGESFHQPYFTNFFFASSFEIRRENEGHYWPSFQRILSSSSTSLLVYSFKWGYSYYAWKMSHGSLALDSAVVWKISKRHFFQDIKNSLHGVTRMGLKPHLNFFQNFFSTNMVARGVQRFCILEGSTDPMIE